MAGVVLGALLAPGVLPASSLTPDDRQVSIESSLDGGASSALTGWAPSASDDGRIVAFVGPAADGRERTVYLRDREVGSLYELTTPPSFAVRPGDSTHPVVSADSCTVTVVTEMAFDLFRDDDRFARWDVYRTTLPHCGGTWGDWELVSATSRGAVDGVSPQQRPSVSASGHVVAFVVPNDREVPTFGRLMIADLTVPVGDSHRLVTVPGLPDGTPTGPYSYVGQAQPSLSADGDLVAYSTDALLGADGTATWNSGAAAGGPARTEVAVWSRSQPTAAPRIVSASPSGFGAADQPALSGDGRSVAFRSSAPGLVDGVVLPPCGEQECTVWQLYLAHLSPGAPDVEALGEGESTARGAPATWGLEIQLLSAWRRDDGVLVGGSGSSSQPSITANGGTVVFISRAPDLVPGWTSISETPGDGEVLSVDVLTGSLRRVTVQPDGATAVTGASAAPHIGSTGRVIVFETSAASQLVTEGAELIGRQVVLVALSPQLSLPALDVGTVPVNWPSPEWFLTLTNEGPGSFTPVAVTLEDPAFMVTGGTCAPLVAVHPGGSCTVNVVYTPVAEGPARATLTISEGGFAATSVSTVIDGAGGEPVLSARPAGIDAGLLTVGTPSGPIQVELTNIGFGQTSVAGVEILGDHAGDFEVSVDRCRGRAFGPNTSCTVDVVVTPRDAGRRSGLLTFVTAAGQRTSVVLSVRGRYEPVLALGADSVVAGQPLTVAGLGVPPSSTVVVTVGQSVRSVAVTAGEWGELDVRLVLPRSARPGSHTVVISDPDDRFDPVTLPLQINPPGRSSSALAPPLRP